MTTRHAPGNPYADDPSEPLSDSVWGEDQKTAEEQDKQAREQAKAAADD